MEPLPVNFGDYVLLDRIGSGGMAEIFLAEGPASGGGEARLVIKRILPHLSSDEQFVKMFVEEARLCLALRHPNIVEVFDLGKADDQYFIAMEYVDGKDLLKTLGACAKKRIPFPTDLALFIITEVLRGLDYAHNLRGPDGRHLGIIHRDVSPSNVFLGMDGRVKIGDFGIAKASTREKTAAGVLKGKFGYMAPEQVMGRPLDHRADVFAVGILLYELLTGHRLFAGKSDILVLERVRQAIVDPPPRHYRPDLSYELERVVLKALAREPDDRFRSTAALHDALRDYVAKAGVSLGPRLLVRFMAELFADGKLPANLPPMPSGPPPGEADRWGESPNTANERLSLESSAPIPESTYDGENETNDLESSWSREGETQDELVRPKELEEEPSEHTEIAARHMPSVVSEPMLPSRLMVRGVDPAEALGPSRDADHETHTAKGAPTPFGGVPVARLGEEARRPKIEPPSARLLLDSNGELRSEEEGSPWDSSSTHEEHQLEPVEEPADEKERTALLEPPPVDEDEETSALDRRQVAEAVAPSFLAPSPPTRTAVRPDSQGGFELSFGGGRDSPESSTAELDDLGASTMIKSPGKVADTLPPPARASDPWPSRASVDAEALAEEAARLPSSALGRPASRAGALHREPSLPSAVRPKPGAIPPQETVRLGGAAEPVGLAHEPTNFGPLIEDHRAPPRPASVDDALDESQEVDAEVRRLVSSSGQRDRDDRTVGGDLAGLLGVSISQIVAAKPPPAAREPSSTRIGRLDRPKNAREAELSGALDRLHSDQDSLSSFDPEEEASLAATGSGEEESAPSLGIGVPVALDPTRPPARPAPTGRRPVFDEPTAALPDLEPRPPSLAVEDTRLRPLEPEPPRRGRGAPPTPAPTPAAPPLDPAEGRPSVPPRMSTAAERRVRAVVERHRAVKEFKRHSVAPPAPPARPAAPPPMPSLPPTADALPPMVPTATAMLPKPAAGVAVSDSEVVVPGIHVSQAAALGTDMRLAIIFAVMALVLVGVLVLLKSRSGAETEALPIPIQPAPRSAATDPVDIPSPEEAEALEARRTPPGRLRVPCRTPVELDVPGIGRVPVASGEVVELPEGTYLLDVHVPGQPVAKRSVRIQAGAEATLACP